MKIHAIRVQNYCAIQDEILECRFLTALVGPNGTGKSSFLRSLSLFFGSAKDITVRDIYNEAADAEIRVTVTFTELSDEVKAALGRYVLANTLTVTKVIAVGEGKPKEAYYGHAPVNADFDSIRRAPGADEMRKQYAALRATAKYSDLPAASTKAAILSALNEREVARPAECQIGLDDGSFIDLHGGIFNLTDHVRFVLIPAIRDATADTGSNGTVPKLLAELAETNVLQEQATLEALQEARTRVLEIVRPGDNAGLRAIGDGITKTLREIAPRAKMHVTWTDPDVQLIPPEPIVAVGEDEYITAVQRAGHGVQRALIIAILQHHSAHESTAASEDGRPVRRLVLAIEEPELFQHPNRQRHLAEVLHKLAGSEGRGVVEKTQVLIATHSPLFVNLDYFDCVRRTYKVSPGAGLPGATKVVKVELSTLAKELAIIEGRRAEDFTENTLRARLRAIMTPWMNEGFFAEKIILVEGESDRAALIAAARVKNINFEELGISVIPAGGKRNLDRPYLVFSRLRIPTYVMWDADLLEPPAETDSAETKKSKNDKREEAIRENRRLLRALRTEEEDFPAGVYRAHAVHGVKLERTLKAELTAELYAKALQDAAEFYGYSSPKDVEKSPEAMERALSSAIAAGGTISFLSEVVDKIREL